MAEIDEQKEISEATKALRHKERLVFKKHSFGNYLTYWDSDEYCLLADYKPVLMRIPDKNTEIIISAKFGYTDKDGRLVVHASQVVELQFAMKEHIEAILLTHKEMGGVTLGDMSSPGLNDMNEYCVKMDKIIAETAKELGAKGVKNIFEKIWKQMGGVAIPDTDRLAKRIVYFKDITSRYRVDKDRWRVEMKRLYLI